MPRHPGLPRPTSRQLVKGELLQLLQAVDSDEAAKQRVLRMETVFRQRIVSHVESLPTHDARLRKFNKSPFVLMFYSLQHHYSHIREIEKAILPAKVFSSMETSAGRMVEAVVLPIYGWEIVQSAMHTTESAIDGRKSEGDTLKLATLKSGPRCLNDEMSENLADAILGNAVAWARSASATKVDFTYGVLYGTPRQSNKKDWHILRNIAEKFPDDMIAAPDNKWDCKFVKDGVEIAVTIRIGYELWNYIAGRDTAFMELCVALIRACVASSNAEPDDYQFTIADIENIISLENTPDDYNVAILHRSQLEWLFFFAYHFCDELLSAPLPRSQSSND